MRNPVLAVIIAFLLVAPCAAVAQSPSLNFQKIEHEYKPQKPDGSLDARRLTTQNKPINPTVNPALQGNVLQKQQGTGGGSGEQLKYDLKASKGAL